MIELFGTKVIPNFDTDPVHRTTRLRATAERKYPDFADPLPEGLEVEVIPTNALHPARGLSTAPRPGRSGHARAAARRGRAALRPRRRRRGHHPRDRRGCADSATPRRSPTTSAPARGSCWSSSLGAAARSTSARGRLRSGARAQRRRCRELVGCLVVPYCGAAHQRRRGAPTCASSPSSAVASPRGGSSPTPPPPSTSSRDPRRDRGSAPTLPALLRRERVVALIMVMTATDRRTGTPDRRGRRRPSSTHEEFVANLIDMCAAVVLAHHTG